jgi:thiol:disulfide interchange protein DsbD
MKLRPLALSAVFCLLSLWAQAAPGPVRKGAVRAELVAPIASIQPGQTFRVALRLDHEEHWHSYWINPGTGYPTTLRWKLPEGFKAGPIIWPVPHVMQDTRGNITGNGYEKTAFLFVDLTAPANLVPGTSVTLQAKADWLMCREVCMPGMADLELTLPVLAETPAPDMRIVRLFNNAVADLPAPLKDWQVTATRTATAIVVRLTPTSAHPDKPTDLHLFDSAGLIDYAAPQPLTEEGSSLVLKLAPAKDGPADATRLSGVLVSANGWGGMVPSHGATFDVELTSQASAASHQAKSDSAPGAGSEISNLKAQIPAPPAAGLAGTLLLALVGGLILNLMPCVFPVLGIKILGFVNQSGHDRKKIVAHGLTFSLGVLLSFWALAGLLLVLRAGGTKLGWGFQLQSPAFVFGTAAFLLVFALNLSGLFEVGLSATGVGGRLQMQSGYAGSFFTGILATVVATPCSAPFLAPALGAALALSPVESFLVFTAIALGLSLPYLLLSAFPQAVRLLPKPGAWMETFKQLMSFPIYATVGCLLWVLAGQTKENDYALLFIILGLVLVAMAGWVYGKFTRGPGRVFTIALAAAGLWIGWPKAEAPAAATAGGYVLKWEHWSPEAVAAARAAGRTIYVDFTARWCATCQTNKGVVFSSGDVLAALEKKNVLLLKADWTSRDPAITEELAKWNRSAVPFNLVYLPGQEPVALPELLTPGVVLDALGKAGAP